MAGELVLLTGASGFVGYLTLLDLLKAGYRVRAAVRSMAKAEKVLAAPSLKALKPSAEQLSWVVVPDMTADRAYDEAAKGVTYIMHVASPIPSFGDDSKAVTDTAALETHFVATAVKSDVGMLESAARAGGTVKRIVVTSSCVAITPFEYYMGTGKEGVVFNAESRIPNAPGPYGFEFEAYSAGKAAALNAMEDYVRTQKPSFDLVVILPGWIFGRDELVTDVASHRKGTTNSVLVNFLVGGRNPSPYNGNAVLGDDVARVHVAALDPAVAGNQAFVASTNMVWDDAHSAMQKYFPDAVKAGKLSVDGEQGTIDVLLDGSKTEKQFGFTFAPYEEVVRRVAEQYLELEAKA